jgi:guanylate kinase
MNLLMLVGPSGVGKGTIIRELRKHRSDIWLSVSATTRAARANETHGVDYFFLSRTEFERMIAKDELLEWAEYAGNYYGTPKQQVMEQLNQGKLVVLEIELAGARQIKAKLPEVIDVMVLPPSLADLADRLNGRGTENEAERRRRLELAEEELAAQGEFRYHIQNDTVSGAVAQLLPLLPAQSSK